MVLFENIYLKHCNVHDDGNDADEDEDDDGTAMMMSPMQTMMTMMVMTTDIYDMHRLDWKF